MATVSTIATEQTRARGLSERFLLHELLITEWDLQDGIAIRNNPHYERLFVERRYFRAENELRFGQRGHSRRVIPDSGSLLRVSLPHCEPTLLLRFKELDKGTKSFSELRSQFQAWDDWARSPEARDYLRTLFGRYGVVHSRPTFQLLVLAHADSRDPSDDDGRLATLLAAALSVSPAMRRRIWMSTAAAMQAHQGDPAPAAAPIWLRAHDVQSWHSEIAGFAGGLPTSITTLRRFAAELLPTMERHRLFSQ